jgi:hypothetical protein
MGETPRKFTRDFPQSRSHKSKTSSTGTSITNPMPTSIFRKSRLRVKVFGSGQKVNLATKSTGRNFFAAVRRFVSAKHS